MQPHKNNDGFTQRLTTCVDRVGGKRAMANAALISEAQLFRYLNAESDVPSDRLMAIAKAAEVDAGWLLTGTGAIEGFKVDVRPSFHPDLLVQVVQTFEELLVESDKKFMPRQKALAISLIYEALRLEEKHKGGERLLDKRLAPFYPDYLAPLRSENRMEDYMGIMHQLEYGPEPSLQGVKQFDTLVKIGLTSVYEGSVGEVYFDRTGTTLLPQAAKRMLETVEKCRTIVGKPELDWLDAGCGTGRHMSFLYQHCPNLTLHGVDLSRLALEWCRKLSLMGKLPIDSVKEADLRQLPYANTSFDVIYSRASLQVLPFIPGHDVGAVPFMNEAYRVLRKGGVMSILTPQGQGRDYVNFIQYYSPDSIRALAEASGFKVLQLEPAPMSETEGTPGTDFSEKLSNGLLAILQKA